MTALRRVFISGPREKYLDARTKALRAAVLGEISRLGYEPTAFGTPEGGTGLAKRTPWNRQEALQAMRRCVGAVLLGFPYWRARNSESETGLVTEYCHYEAALAAALDLPILALLEAGTAGRGAFDPRAGTPVLEVPADATADWVAGAEFQNFAGAWVDQLRERRDVFLGYSSAAKRIALAVRKDLEVAGITVIDWARDFRKAGSILTEIEAAAARCSAAILLFTRDDKLADAKVAMPRDNVLLEAGYFTRAKGKERVLIAREEGAKMPADLGGDIHVPFKRGKTDALLEGVRDFIRERL
jgi:hypothetical protein